MLAETAICVTSSNDLAGIYLAGVRVPDGDVQMLASLVDEPTRSVLDNALKCGTVSWALRSKIGSEQSRRWRRRMRLHFLNCAPY